VNWQVVYNLMSGLTLQNVIQRPGPPGDVHQPDDSLSDFNELVMAETPPSSYRQNDLSKVVRDMQMIYQVKFFFLEKVHFPLIIDFFLYSPTRIYLSDFCGVARSEVLKLSTLTSSCRLMSRPLCTLLSCSSSPHISPLHTIFFSLIV
jgi:hypothetical protein